MVMRGYTTPRRLAALAFLSGMLFLPADLSQGHDDPAASRVLGSVVIHGPMELPDQAGTLGPTPPARSASGQPAHGLAGQLRMALTFDSNMTDAMLRWLSTGKVKSYANVGVIDELERTQTPATFFLSGKWVERYPDLTRRIAADPNFELASHSYAHRAFTAHCYDLAPIPTDQMAADVEHSFQVLARFGGRQTRYFRFPGGCYDARALRAIAPTHCTVVQYDVVGKDAFNNDVTAIINAVLGNAHNGAIVVLHITQANAPRTADALSSIITGLRARGYHLVTLSDLVTTHPQ